MERDRNQKGQQKQERQKNQEQSKIQEKENQEQQKIQEQSKKKQLMNQEQPKKKEQPMNQEQSKKEQPMNREKSKKEQSMNREQPRNWLKQGMKQLRIGLIAVLMMLLITSCGQNPNPADSGGWVWVPEFTSFEMGDNSYFNIAFLGDAFYYISYERQSESFSYRLSGYSLTDGRLPDIPLEWQDGMDRFVTSLYAMDEDGSIYLIAYVLEEEDSWKHLCKFDAKGKLVYDVDISEEMDDADLLAVDSQGRTYISASVSGNPCVLLYTPEGDYRGTVLPDVPNGVISAMGRGKDGKIYACCRGNSGGGDIFLLTEIDFDNGKMGVSYPDFPKGDDSTLVPGLENGFLSYDRTTVYTYDLTTQTAEALFEWQDYDIDGSEVTAVNVLEDGSILAVIMDFPYGNGELAVLKKVDSAQAVQKETIVLGTIYSNSTLRNAVTQFNRSSDKYHVKIKEYLDTNTYDWSDAAIRMNNDILSSSCPDILDLSNLNLKALASKGLFADLNEYLESSSLLDRSDFLDNLLDAYTVGDKLITIPAYFSLKTVMGWSAEVGEEMGWTLDELMTYADAHPDAELFNNASRREMMQYLMCYNEDAFIDWSSGECYFDSDAFKRLLEFVGRFPGEAEQTSEQSSTPVRIQNGEVLLYEENIMDFDSIQLPLAIYGNEGTCIGFPAADGSAGCMLIPYSAYAITVKSDRKEGAWAFIESFLTLESNRAFFPALKSELELKAAEAVKEEQNPMGISYSDWEFAFHAVTQKEVDLVLDLIDAAKPVSGNDGDEVINIINEEAEGYYQGQKTVSEVAEIIQSRIWIYVNEE